MPRTWGDLRGARDSFVSSADLMISLVVAKALPLTINVYVTRGTTAGTRHDILARH